MERQVVVEAAAEAARMSAELAVLAVGVKSACFHGRLESNTERSRLWENYGNGN